MIFGILWSENSLGCQIFQTGPYLISMNVTNHKSDKINILIPDLNLETQNIFPLWGNIVESKLPPKRKKNKKKLPTFFLFYW